MAIPDSLFEPLAAKCGTDVPNIKQVLRQPKFLGGCSEDQTRMLLLQVNASGLNPITGEASFLDFGGGRSLYCGPDGYIAHGLKSGVTGMTFTEGKRNDDVYVTCKLRKGNDDYEVTEYLRENKVNNSKAWRDSPFKMLRHRAMQSAIRIACGMPGTPADEMEAIGATVPQTPTRVDEALAAIRGSPMDNWVRILSGGDPEWARKLRNDSSLTADGPGFILKATSEIAQLCDDSPDLVEEFETAFGPITEIMAHKASMKIRATGSIEAKSAK